MIKKQSSDVQVVIKELQQVNSRIDRLLKHVPTSDDKVLAELDQLINKQRHLLYKSTTKEQGTYFLEQATGMAMSLKERYFMLLSQGRLRKKM